MSKEKPNLPELVDFEECIPEDQRGPQWRNPQLTGLRDSKPTGDWLKKSEREPMKTIVVDLDGNEKEFELPSTIRLHFKTPDALHYAVQDLNLPEGVDPDGEGLGFIEEQYNDRIKKWLEYGEQITVEFDVENMTARVVER